MVVLHRLTVKNALFDPYLHTTHCRSRSQVQISNTLGLWTFGMAGRTLLGGVNDDGS